MFRTTGLFVILLFYFVPSFAYPDQILFGPRYRQDAFCDSLCNVMVHLDSASDAAIYSDLKTWASTKGDVRLVYALRIMEDKYIVDALQNKGAGENDLIQLLDELRNKNLEMLHAKAAFVLSRCYWARKQYAAGFEYGIRAYNYCKNYDKDDEAQSQVDYITSLGGMYYHFKDFTSAKRYFLEAIRTMEPEKNTGGISLLNTTALTYLSLERYDSAKYYFGIAKDLAAKKNNDIWPQIIDGNLGYVNYLLKDYDAAIPLLERDVERCRKDASRNAAYSLGLLADIYVIKNDRIKAVAYAEDVHSLIFKEEELWKDNEVRRRIYPMLARVYALQGNAAKAYAYEDSGMRSNDTVQRQTNALVLAGVQHSAEANERLETLQLQEREEKMNKWVRDGLAIGIVLLLVIAYLIINRQKHKNAHEQQKLKNKSMEAEAELKTATQKLADFTHSIAEKNDLIETFGWELNRLKTEMGSDKKDGEALAKLMQHTILTDTDWENFRELFDNVYKGFIHRLNTKVRGLSPVEMRVMLLCRLQLPAKEMAAMLGISIEAVRVNKQKLRTKLGLPDTDHSLEEFVLGL